MADRTITYYDVVQEILKRVNDAEGDVYLDRAKSLVYEGISTLAVSEGVTKDDIVGILKSETVDVGTFSPNYKMKIKGDSKDLDYNPARIISIVDDFTDADETVLNQVTKHRYIELSLLIALMTLITVHLMMKYFIIKEVILFIFTHRTE